MRHPESRREGTNANDVHILFWLATAAAAALSIARFSYDFGVSDQDEFLPLLAHLLDPNVLTADWLTGIQASSFNVRTVFVYTLLPVARWLGPVPAVHILYALSFAGVALGIYRIALYLHRDPALAAMAVVGAIALTARWSPGGNDIVSYVLLPSIPAWAFALNGLATVLRGRLTTRRAAGAALLLAAAVALQALIGLQTGAVAVVTVLAMERRRMRRVIVFTTLVVSFSAPAALPLAFQTGFFDSADRAAITSDDVFKPGERDQVTDTLSASDVLVRIRAPHHYLPSAFPAGRWIRLWLVLFAGGAFLWRRPDLIEAAVRHRILVALALSLAALAFCRIWVGLRPTGFVALLQPFKLTVLVRVLGIVAAVGWFYRLARLRRTIAAGLTLPVVGLTAILVTGSVETGRLFPFADRASEPVGRVHAWIASATPAESVFAVPPGHTGFSWATHRAQYVNFKAMPFIESQVLVWLERIRTVAPFVTGEFSGFALLDELDRSFHARHPSEWRAVMQGTSVNYLLLRRGDHFWYPPESATYCNSGWCVYSERDLNSIDEWRYATD